ncbi:hypothetical protein [Pseudomonas quasicaspiana]|uniref:hypothetical protein n=1 Tax=Pseudomonas quasicaspiana TaxID=2829821 RepID=UPI001E5F1060|nr:hypothetical protein [Pseudomonas quasicaspiana]MCD5978960.1 hypothetical protein [Pseudomonas quasicaspiana]
MIWLKLALICAPFLLTVMTFVFNTYIGNRYLDTMLDALKNSRHVLIHSAVLRHQGWVGRGLLVTKISSVVIWPGLLVRKGEVDCDDIKDFPPDLRFLLKVYLWLLISAGAGFVIVYVLAKLR